MSNQAVLSKNPNHISSIDAAKQFGYTHDYISRLAREKKIVGMRVGRQWYVDAASLDAFVKESTEAKKMYAEKLRAERRRESASLSRKQHEAGSFVRTAPEVVVRPRAVVLARAGAVVCTLVIAWAGVWNLSAETGATYQKAGVLASLEWIARAFYGFEEVPIASDHSEGVGEGAYQKVRAGVSESNTPSFSGDDAMVVVPPYDSRRATDIARHFSDEVEVRPDPSGTGGVIVPHFVHASTTPYRYLMVPMQVAGSPP